MFGGLNLTPQQLRAGQPHRADRLRHQLARGAGGRIPDRGVRPAFRSKWNTPASCAIAIRRWTTSTLVFAITQSGETADTLAALREMKRKGHPTLAICNVVGSTIAQEADGGIYLHAGPEIGVASTKAFTSQCAVLAMLALYFGRLRHLSFDAGMRIIERAAGSCPTRCAQALRMQRRGPADRREVLPLQQLPLPGPAVQLSHGAGRGAEAQGNQLHPRRGLSGRRDEARPDRPGRRAHAQRVPHPAGLRLRQGDVEPGRDQSPRRPGDRHRRAKATREVADLADDVIDVPARRGLLAADRDEHPAATAGLSHRRAARLRRRQAPQPGQERDGGVATPRRFDARVPRAACPPVHAHVGQRASPVPAPPVYQPAAKSPTIHCTSGPVAQLVRAGDS